MSTMEDQELMTRINQLTGQINRHKAQQGDVTSPADYQNPSTYSPRGNYHGAAPYHYRGYRARGGYRPSYRNKSLVLNGQSQPPAPSDTDANGAPDSASPSWVTKKDRHLQLINSSIYEQEAQNRHNAIEQTFRRKQWQRDQREKKTILKHLHHQGVNVASRTTNAPSSTPAKYEVEIEGIRFLVTKQGSKLVRSAENGSFAPTTPKSVSVGGVKFHRTKTGNLVRHGVTKAQRLAGGIKKVNEPCKTFSWTGSCSKGPRCRFIHDPTKVAICREWMHKGRCQNGDSCDLVHEMTEQRTPLCMHFAKGKCSNASCPYIHVEHAPSDPVCHDFGTYGFCAKGTQCPDRHVFECPDFTNTGVCKTKGCKLLHRERASVLRKASHRGPSQGDYEMTDISSDDDESSGDGDDVDSDEVEEFIGNDEAEDPHFAEQKDYIGFC